MQRYRMPVRLSSLMLGVAEGKISNTAAVPLYGTIEMFGDFAVGIGAGGTVVYSQLIDPELICRQPLPSCLRNSSLIHGGKKLVSASTLRTPIKLCFRLA